MNNEGLPKKYRNAYHKTRLNVVLTGMWIEDQVKTFMRDYQITPQQYNILQIVEHNKGEALSILQIREQMLEKMSDTSRLVERLIQKELVTKETSIIDKRLVEIKLTPKGEATLAAIAKNVEQLDIPFQSINDEEAEELSRLLIKLRRPQKK